MGGIFFNRDELFTMYDGGKGEIYRKRQVLGYPNTLTLTPTHDVRAASVLL